MGNAFENEFEFHNNPSDPVNEVDYNDPNAENFVQDSKELISYVDDHDLRNPLNPFNMNELTPLRATDDLVSLDKSYI